MPSPPPPESIAATATRLAEMEILPRDIRLAIAHVLREAGAELRRGRPLPTRLHRAMGELVGAVEAARGQQSDGIEFP